MLAAAAQQDFLAWLTHERRASALTVEAYAHHIGTFLAFLREHLGAEPELDALGTLRVADFRAWLAYEARPQTNGRNRGNATRGDDSRTTGNSDHEAMLQSPVNSRCMAIANGTGTSSAAQNATAARRR